MKQGTHVKTRKLSEWLAPGLCVGVSPIHGSGLFTVSGFAAGDIVTRWGGILIEAGQYDEVEHRAAATTRYDETYWLTQPQSSRPTIGESLNHSCDPNTWMNDEVTVIARRRILPGEEVTTDFALWSDMGHVYTTACRCASPSCRRVITGMDWLQPQIQIRYNGHFIPCIQRKIDAARP